MDTKDSIVIGDGTSVKVGDIVHVVDDTTDVNKDILTFGKVSYIVRGGDKFCDFLEVDINGVICEIIPDDAFSDRKKLVRHYIKDMEHKIKFIENSLKYLDKEKETTENKLGYLLVQIHELKKEIEEQ